ncbi:MAG: DMT family transporter [Clostridiales bacterium]|nr:DMT family transporter [Clostridiales bacterium]
MAHLRTKGSIKYILLLIAVTIIWGSAFLFVKDLVNDANMPVLLLTCVRFALGSLFLLSFRFFMPKKVKFKKKEVLNGAVVGAVTFAAFAFQTYGAYFTTPSKNGMLTGLYVVIVPIILSCLTKKIKWKPFADAFLCLIGVAVLFNFPNGDFLMNTGDLLTVLGAAAFAVQFVMLEKYAPQFNTLNYTIIQLAAVACLAFAGTVIFERAAYQSININLPMVMKVFYLAFLATGFAYIVQTAIQVKLPSTTVSLLACLESVFAVCFSVMFKYDNFTVNLAVGAVIMIVSMASAVALPQKENKLQI